MSIDARWAQHASYLFWACNIVEAYKLQSSISVALCLRNPGTRDSTKKEEKSEQRKEHCLTAGDLRSSSAEDNPDVRENYYSFMTDIQETAAYWQAAKIQSFAMLHSLGSPTFFITFSADDHHSSTSILPLVRKKECHFDFPRPLSSETRLKNNNDMGNKSRFYLLKQNKGDENVNAHNADLLAWQANMDIPLIGSVYGTASYICSYMCKGESDEVKK